MSDRAPARMPSGLGGRPPRNARVFLERTRPILVARWVGSCRRALRYLNDPKTPIDANWIRLFNSLADRLGHPRVTSQTVESASFSASVHEERVVPANGAVTDSDALRYLEARIQTLRASREAGSGG